MNNTKQDLHTILCAAMLVMVIFVLAGCQSFDPETIGVDATDNAILCVKAHLDTIYTDSSADYTRIELPASLDLSKVTPELAEALAAIADRMGC